MTGLPSWAEKDNPSEMIYYFNLVYIYFHLVSIHNTRDFEMANHKACVAPAGQRVEGNMAETVS